jgi:hypothetical protein
LLVRGSRDQRGHHFQDSREEARQVVYLSSLRLPDTAMTIAMLKIRGVQIMQLQGDGAQLIS